MKYSHIEGVMGIDSDYLTSAEERAIVTKGKSNKILVQFDIIENSANCFCFHHVLRQCRQNRYIFRKVFCLLCSHKDS